MCRRSLPKCKSGPVPVMSKVVSPAKAPALPYTSIHIYIYPPPRSPAPARRICVAAYLRSSCLYSAAAAITLQTQAAHCCLGRPRRRLAAQTRGSSELGLHTSRRIGWSAGIWAMLLYTSTCRFWSTALNNGSPAVSRTVTLLILERYEQGMRSILLKHLTWNASILCRWFCKSQSVSNPYRSFDTTQAL